VIVTCPLSFCTLGDGPTVYHAGAITWSAEQESEAEGDTNPQLVTCCGRTWTVGGQVGVCSRTRGGGGAEVFKLVSKASVELYQGASEESVAKTQQ
jgi:hypothetical protein